MRCDTLLPLNDQKMNVIFCFYDTWVDNLDLRAEWFFANGNTLTISLFNKEIADPIDYFESPAGDTNTAR